MFVLKDLFVVTRRGRSYQALFFCGTVFVRLTRSRLSEREEEFLPTLRFSLSAINTMLLCWLGGPCPCQLFSAYICILNNLITVIRLYKKKRRRERLVWCIQHACKEKDSVVQMSSIVITE